MRADATGTTPYEALMDKFRPGMREAQLQTVFGAVKQWLPGLIDAVVQRQAQEPMLQAQGPFPWKPSVRWVGGHGPLGL